MAANQDSPQQLLQQALELSLEMNRLAKAGEWSETQALEQRRRPLLERCFTSAQGFADRDQAAALVREILAMDEQTMGLAKQTHDEVGAALAKIGQGLQATRAYQKVGP